VVYFVARKWFGFSREWSVPLTSGISNCGVAVAIATGGAIRARPAVPILVWLLVVVFARSLLPRAIGWICAPAYLS
jgi:uncharacterized membrane protein YadS